MIIGVLAALLLAWVVLVLLGLFIKAVFWLAIVGAVGFAITLAIGAVHHRASGG